MELSKNFEHKASEEKWYSYWNEQKYFNSTPDDREPFTIVIPPPNVTGVLHMGHCLNNTIQDVLVRRARMQGKNACWVPGTDHASIATEAKVVQMLREKGIQKASISRDEFLGYAWEWKEKYGGIILQQLKKMGCSLDWERTSFTMDPDYYQSVISVFVDLYNKGFLYRGKRMINWDVKAKTALSDEEVIRKETQQKLYHLRYKIDGLDEHIIIATVRPETIMGDTAICVHPKDERYKHLHGKFAFVPLINRRIPIITDEYVTMEFGTGALKVTPAHDMNDYQLGQKHNLEVVDIFNEDGTLNEDAQILIGEERFEARKKIVIELEEKGHLIKTEDYTSEVGYSERTDAVVEPRLSLQWWVDMKKISGPALNVVMNDDVKFYPAKFKNLYRHWMENIKDWCISRQLWWGHRIPAWYDADGNYVVAATHEDALQQYQTKFGKAPADNTLSQDEDCLDTWFSSWLWPFEVFKGYSNPGNADVQYYYPTNTLVTAPEIIFFWVARMIMAGMEYQKEIPFKEVYFTGIVRDKQGRKMSKSLGNSPDLLELIDKYGADACRFGILIASPAGNDLLWEESSNEQGRNFNNKLWNALKLVKMWEGRTIDHGPQTSGENSFEVEWFDNRLNEAKAEIDQLFKEFRLSEALKTIYSLIWDDFCSWYLEWVKPGFEQPIDAAVYNKTVEFFEELMQLLHPFMPFISEEIYHALKERAAGDDITIKQLSSASKADKQVLQLAIQLKEVITALRDIRVKNQIKPKEAIKLSIETDQQQSYRAIESILAKQLNAESISYVSASVAGTISAVIQKDKFYIATKQAIDTSSQKEQMLKDLEYLKGFLLSVEKKLGNERFVQNARPEVVDIEKKKKADAEAKIKAIEESLASL
ncbi:valine--tRNA ligase [Lacibacter sp.]|uniref:valine--tRNA ligase n=1 Tax=Lacibacter sp. TaxID=1915409 RepID=UPI002B4B1AA1|nr:valine--tRNA ligase [Lacibacter sp.]HLP37159.1 valine--tRNA ligase [Lacibacter sp.]